jgi:hypothetical protein
MKDLQPPRLAMALLQRIAADNEPLVGDLLEEFGARQSRVWFWRQVLHVLLIGSLRNGREVRPLKLVEHPSALQARRPGDRLRVGPKPVNLSGSPIALGTLVTLGSPQFWWVALVTILAGLLFGIVRVLLRRRQDPYRAGHGKVLAG